MLAVERALGVGWFIYWGMCRAETRAVEGRAEGHCRFCRYDLTGNTSGVCLECGVATAKGSVRPLLRRPFLPNRGGCHTLFALTK